MKTSEELFKAWSSLLQQENILNEDDLKNLQDVSFCRNHKFLGRYNIPVILLKSIVENDRKYDGRLYKRFFLFDKYSISNDWYHSEVETNRRDFFRWFVDLCKQKGVYDKVPQIIIEEAESSPKVMRTEPPPTNSESDDSKTNNTSVMSFFQTIFFGAPGTGKSHKIDYNLFKDKNGNLIGKGINEIPGDRKFRTTFHPDYDYAQFVGAYKPKKEGEKITYSFVPQVFAKAYAAAWKLYLQRDTRDSIGASPLQNDGGKDIQVYLVIEEINRGNCAQIFGDIFQLLDRDEKGFSQYSIDADCDFATWLKEDSILKTVWSDYETKFGDGKLKLPPNLNILATMNTSDQSLFPMDSAFKRRFDWEYVPINYEKAEADFIVGDTSFNFKWLEFLKKVNADIYKVTQSEDKQMGEFFIKPKNKDYITLDEFRSKVLFYLWDSVYKDELDSKLVFHFAYPEKGPDVTFQRLFNSDFVEILKKMLANLDNEYKDGAQQG